MKTGWVFVHPDLPLSLEEGHRMQTSELRDPLIGAMRVPRSSRLATLSRSLVHWAMPDTRISEQTRAAVAQAWQGMLDEIAGGAEIGKTLSAAGISRNVVRAYIASTPEARAQWDEAREASADAYFDKACAMANSRVLDPAAARVQLQAWQWLASIRNPRVYSQKATLDVNVRTVDLTRIISDANARLAASRGRVIEHAAGSMAPELLTLIGSPG
jgi:hypothetical protein